MTISNKGILSLLAVCVVAVGSLYPAAATAAGGGCKSSAITGSSQFDPASGAYLGSGTLELEGHVIAIEWASVITSFVANADGTLTLGGSHHITGNSIDITTSDEVTAVPTEAPGVYTFTSHLTIVSGAGRTHSGFLGVLGRVDLSNGSVVIDSSQGTLCAKP